MLGLELTHLLFELFASDLSGTLVLVSLGKKTLESQIKVSQHGTKAHFSGLFGSTFGLYLLAQVIDTKDLVWG